MEDGRGRVRVCVCGRTRNLAWNGRFTSIALLKQRDSSRVESHAKGAKASKAKGIQAPAASAAKQTADNVSRSQGRAGDLIPETPTFSALRTIFDVNANKLQHQFTRFY